MSLGSREKAEREITRLKGKTGLPLPLLLGLAGIPERTWQERRGVATRHHGNIPRGYYLTPEEEEAIVNYCRLACASHPEKGCRTLCWEMVDKNIARVGESSVYNVINRYKPAKKWDQIGRAGRTRFRPTQGRPRAMAYRFVVHQDSRLVLLFRQHP